MIQIFVASIFLIIAGCQKKEINVKVNTVGAKNKGAYKSVALELNKGIQNIRAEVDKDKSLIKIEFDYPSQKWPYMYYNQSAPFLVRLFDKNGQVLQYFTTKETFMSSKFKSIIKQKSPGLSHSSFNKSIPLKDKGNVLAYQIDTRNTDYVETVEFGWGIVNWFDSGKGYYENYPKEVPTDSCVYQEEMKIYKMKSNDIPKLGVYCQRPNQGKIVFDEGEVSIYLPEVCRENDDEKFYPKENQCCAKNFPRKRGDDIKYISGIWRLSGQKIKQENITGDCKCPEGLILQTNNGGEAYCGDPASFFSKCIEKESNPFWKKDKDICLSICKYSGVKDCDKFYKDEISKKAIYY